MAYSKIIILGSGGMKFRSSPIIESIIQCNLYSGFELGKMLPSILEIGLLVSYWPEIENFGNMQIALLEISFF